MKTIVWRVFSLLTLTAAVAVGAAQDVNSGDIRGSVTDSTGALVPGVTVQVENVDTGVTKTVTTNSAGLYDTNGIVIGHYKLTFIMPGFKKYVRGPVTIEVGYTTVNAQLQLGNVSQTVVVTTNVPLLDTETGEQKTILTSKSMQQLPQVGEDWENFMILLPGATGTPGGSQGSSNPGQAASFDGSLPYNNITADGASTTLSHSQNANPDIFEDVAEVDVQASTFDAQYSVGGAIINQISKGGTSHFHGEGYEFYQDNSFNAAQYGFASHPTVPYIRYNNPGFNVGGPVDVPFGNLKHKMFFFFGYDQIIDHGSASNATNSIPTPAVMSGNFTGQLPIYDPTTQTIALDSHGNPYPVRKSFQQEYGSNSIPTTMFDTVSANFQQFYPTPTNHIAGGKFVPGTVGADGEIQNNFYSTLPQSTPYRKFFGRLDYDITPSNRLTMSDTQSDTPVVYPNSVTAYPIGWQSGDVDNNNAAVQDFWTISPNITNQFVFGFTDQLNFFADLSLNHGYPAKLGWQFAKANDIPAIQFYRNYPYAWIEPSTNAVYKEDVFDPSEVLTIIHGKHVLKFGGEMLIYRDDSTAWGNTNAGTLGFDGAYTEEWDHASCGSNAYADQRCPDPNTGLEYADFLLGYSSNWNANVSPEYGARFKSPQFFAQDDYKIRPNLTLDFGLRYQFNLGWKEVHGNEASFDTTVPNPAPNPFTGAINTPGAWWFATTHTNGRTALIAPVYNIWLPRVGASWSPKPNTTVRGGFGIYAYNWSLDNYGGNNSSYGMGAAISSSGNDSDQTNGIIPITQLDGPGTVFGTSAPLPYTKASNSPTAYNGQAGGFILYHTPVPRMMEWNLSVQRAFLTNFVAQVAYVASHGSNLIFTTDLNAVPASELSSNDVALGDRPYPLFQGLPGSSNNGISNYNSLQLSITKRMTHGVSFSANYVWSHMLDSQDSSGWGSREGPQNYQIANNLQENYSNSNFDVRNAFKGYVVYQLPFGIGQAFLSKGKLLNEVVGGWQISSTIVEQSGQPFTVFGTQNTYQQAGSPFPNRNPGVSTKPANRHATCSYAGDACDNEWYNPAAFTMPANGTFGNVRRNSLYGPGINEVNISGAKSFAIPVAGDPVSLQLRIDVTNAFNHPSFNQPTGTLAGASGPGAPYSYAATPQQITGTTVGGRAVQLGAEINF